MPTSQTTAYEGLRRGWHAVCKTAFPKLSEPEILRNPVRSRSVATLGHDPKRGCLQVEYFNGVLYRVDGVSAKTYQQVMDAKDFDVIFQIKICARHPMTRIGAVPPVFG